VTAKTAALLRQALELAPEERADLAAELLASLEPADDPDEVERAWAAEIARRIEKAEAEGFPGEDWKAVCQRVLDNLHR